MKEINRTLNHQAETLSEAFQLTKEELLMSQNLLEMTKRLMVGATPASKAIEIMMNSEFPKDVKLYTIVILMRTHGISMAERWAQRFEVHMPNIPYAERDTNQF